MVRHQPKRKPFNFFWNLLTLLVVMASALIFILQLTIYVNPYAIFNPFPPVDLPERIILPENNGVTATPTEEILPTEVLVIAATATKAATATPVVEIQDGTLVAETTPQEPTPTPFVGYYAFVAQDEPKAIPSTIFKPDLECSWAGVAGLVFDLQGRPVKGIIVWLRGSFGGKTMNYQSVTLESSPYGPSGFEFTFGDTPRDTSGDLYLQLADQAGIPISDRVYFDTFSDCEKNLILVNFKQVR